MTQLTVVIIGGGIGGLFAANALIAHGFDVSVYEQAPALGEVGAGVFLTPNSVRQLQRAGLGPQVERWGARVGHGSHYFRHDGVPIAPVQVTDSAGWNATFGMHRADLVEMLWSALPPGVVRTGHPLSKTTRHLPSPSSLQIVVKGLVSLPSRVSCARNRVIGSSNRYFSSSSFVR